MDVINIKTQGQKLLDLHSNLYYKLIKIPENRKMIYREEFENGKKFGLPRFKPEKYEWPQELLKKIRDHLQNIHKFFDTYSYWYDNTIIPLIDYRYRRESKKSIIFLLENDVWETDEVYGKYLIEKSQNETIVSYYRRDKRIKEFPLKTTNDSEIKEWICRNAIKQIKEQFEFSWIKLETEINVCIKEKFQREPKLTLTSNYLRDQLEKTKKISKEWSEAALLNLGRIAEIWLLIALGYNNTPKFEDIIRTAEVEGIIDKHDAKLLRKIKTNYNDLKHKAYCKIERDNISNLIIKFLKMFVIDA